MARDVVIEIGGGDGVPARLPDLPEHRASALEDWPGGGFVVHRSGPLGDTLVGWYESRLDAMTAWMVWLKIEERRKGK